MACLEARRRVKNLIMTDSGGFPVFQFGCGEDAWDWENREPCPLGLETLFQKTSSPFKNSVQIFRKRSCFQF